MAVASTDRPFASAVQLKTQGLYLTDGDSLYRVRTAHEGYVALEDCAEPDELPAWLPVKDLLDRRMKVVRAA